MDLTVAVMAKECTPGRVKTRLTPPLTPAAAAELAQLSLARTLDTVRRLPARRRLLVMDGTPRTRDAKGFTVTGQGAGTLDERLADICDAADGPLLILGMDTPQFSAGHLAALLGDWSAARPAHDAWLGPAEDGGFWTVALLRPRGALIRGVPMSTATTGARQLARLAGQGLSTGLLPGLRDMDFFADAVGIAAAIPGTDFASAVAALAAQLPGHPPLRGQARAEASMEAPAEPAGAGGPR